MVEQRDDEDDLQGLLKLLGEEESTGLDGSHEMEEDPSLPDPTAAAPAERWIAHRFEVLRALGDTPIARRSLVRDHAHQARERVLVLLHAPESASLDVAARAAEHVERGRALAHESIVRPRESGRTPKGQVFLLEDTLQGEPLARVLARRGTLAPTEVLEIARQILLALEQGHRAGIAHGALSGTSVFLLDRVPFSPSNPHAIAVRVTDFGLAEALGEGALRPLGPERDLADLASLLVLALTGTRPAPGELDLDTSPALSHLSGRTRALLRRAFAPAPRERFGSAEEFRRAIERSPDGVAPSLRLRTRTRALALVSLAAVLALAAFLLERTKSHTLSAAERARSSELASLRDDFQRLDRDLAGEATRVRELAEELAAKDVELASVAMACASDRASCERVESQRLTLSAQLASARSREQELTGELDGVRSRLIAAEAARRAEELAGDPDYRAARSAGAVLQAIASADLGRAREELANFPARAVPGRDALAGLVDLADALERAETDGDPGRLARAVLDARDAEARARAGLSSLASEPWLVVPEPTGELPERRAALEAGLEALARRGLQSEQALAPRLEARWSELEVAIEPDPALASDLARVLGGERLGPLLERYAARVAATGESDGRLDLAGLAGLERLDDFGALVDRDGALAASEAGRTLRLFRFARHFFASAERDASLPDLAVEFDPSTLPPYGWRDEIALRHALLDPERGWHARPGLSALFSARTAEGATSWQLDVTRRDPDPPARASRSVLVERTFFDAQGALAGSRTLRAYLQGKRFLEEDTAEAQVLDLGLPQDATLVRSWRAETPPEPPALLPIARAAIEAWCAEHGDKTRLALAVEDGLVTTLFLPELGLVSHRDPERIERHLVWAELE